VSLYEQTSASAFVNGSRVPYRDALTGGILKDVSRRFAFFDG